MTPPHVDGCITAIFGVPGSGKTTLAVRFIERAQADGRVVVCYDPTRDLRRYMDDRAIQHRPIDSGSGSALILAAKRRNVPAVFVTSEPVCVWALAAADVLARCTLVLDEAQQLFPSAGIALPAAKYLELNRNRGIESVIIAKKPQRVNTDVRSNASHVLVFRQQSKAAIDCLGDCADPAVWEPAIRLPKFSYLYRPPWRDDEQEPLDEWTTDDALPYDWPDPS